MDKIQQHLLQEVAGLHEVPEGAYSLRINGSLHGKNSSENIEIVQKTDKPGIDIYVKAGTKKESLHIPVILSQTAVMVTWGKSSSDLMNAPPRHNPKMPIRIFSFSPNITTSCININSHYNYTSI